MKTLGTRAVTVLATALACALPTAPQDNAPRFTGDMLNCRGWRSANSDVRLGYVIGAHEGFGHGVVIEGVISGRDRDAVLDDAASMTAKAPLTASEEVQVINEFCARPENSAVQAFGVLEVVKRKADGASPETIEGVSARLRREAAAATAK